MIQAMVQENLDQHSLRDKKSILKRKEIKVDSKINL